MDYGTTYERLVTSLERRAYAVIEGDRLIATSGRIAIARKHRTGIAGRRIIRLDGGGERIQLRAFGGGGIYHITGVEVT